MKQKELAALSDQELLQEAKKIKSANIASSVLIGVIIGIAIYSTVKNRFGFFTFFPLFFVLIAVNNSNNSKAAETLLKERNMK